MKNTSLFLILLFVCNISAQITFEKAYDASLDQHSETVLQTSDNYFVLAGYIKTSSSNWDIRLIKTDSHGDTVWTRIYPREWAEIPEVLVETDDHNYLLAGYAVTVIAPSRYDALLMKIATNGDTIWTKTIGIRDHDEQIFDMRPTADGGYILCGIDDERYTDYYYYLLKVNANGDSLWSVTYNPAPGDQARGRAVVETEKKEFVIAGQVKRDDEFFAHLVKIDSTGRVIWQHTWDEAGVEALYDIQITSDNGYIIGGYKDSSDTANMNFYLVRTDTLGDTLWTRTYGGPSQEFLYAVEQTADGGFLLAGSSASYGSGSDDFYLIKTDENGDTSWTRTFGGRHRDNLYDMKITTDGGFVLIGGSYNFYPWQCSYMVKTDSEGKITSIFSENINQPGQYYLGRNYPNPFNPITNINYELPVTNYIELSIYNLLGQKIATLVSQIQNAGKHRVQWDASGYASGVYYYMLKAGDFRDIKKMVFIK